MSDENIKSIALKKLKRHEGDVANFVRTDSKIKMSEKYDCPEKAEIFHSIKFKDGCQVKLKTSGVMRPAEKDIQIIEKAGCIKN